MLDLNKTAKLNETSPNPRVFDMKTKEFGKLLDFINESRPTVINFGSCTWPPFMANLEKIKKVVRLRRQNSVKWKVILTGKFQLAASFSPVADFVTLYIEEAHSVETGDYINYFLPIKRHG